MNSRVLIIHNDPNICAAIQAALYEAAIAVDIAFSSSEAINLFLHYDYSLRARLKSIRMQTVW